MKKGSHHTKEAKAKIGKNPKCGFQKGNKPTHMFKGMKSQQNKYNFTEKELMELYIEKELTQKDIAEIKGCDAALVFHHMKKFGIEARKPKDIKGDEFGKLTARYYVGKNKHNKSLYFCECECGGTKTVTRNALVTGNSQSCGCSMKGENNHNWTGGKNSYICKQCCEPFERYEKQDDTHTNEFCSTKCAALFRAPTVTGENSPVYVPRIKKACGFCGKKLILPRWKDQYENNFCSREEGENLSKCHIAWMSENRIGKDNANYRGGPKTRNYPREFSEPLKDRVKLRDNHKCRNPRCKYDGDFFNVHHIDIDIYNNDMSNLIYLCVSCHGAAHNVFMMTFYKRLMSSLYGYEYEQQLSLLEAVNQ